MSNLEKMHGLLQWIIDSFLDVPAMMCARAGSRTLREKYSPLSNTRWAGVTFDLCARLRCNKITAQGAAFVCKPLGIRFPSVREAVYHITRYALGTDDTSLVEWFFREFGSAAAFELGASFSSNGINSHYNYIKDIVCDTINDGNINAAAWMIHTFEIDIHNRLPELTTYAVGGGTLKTLRWLEAFHKEKGLKFEIDLSSFSWCNNIDILRHLLDSYQPETWSYDDAIWCAIYACTQENFASSALYLLWRFAAVKSPNKYETLLAAQEESRTCTGRDGARLRKKLDAIISEIKLSEDSSTHKPADAILSEIELWKATTLRGSWG